MMRREEKLKYGTKVTTVPATDILLSEADPRSALFHDWYNYLVHSIAAMFLTGSEKKDI